MTEHQDDIPGPEDTTEEEISPAPSPRSSADPLIGTKIGSCTLKRIIGSGGMGTVYEAVQEKPRRRVALKMMKRGITSRSATRRFEFESQTLARLQHPGVAQIYEAGTHDDGSGGVPYFIMEYIANAKPITNYADEKKLGTKDRLSLFTKVCEAVQHGHLKGIVHRDLKPGNILVDSSGQPKIIDFGVARSTDSDLAVTTLQTDVGQLIGTLQYMSPEQCEADPSDIDIRSDVYALGVILYELLTGKPPYDLQQKAIHEAVRIVREEEPTKLSTIDRHLRGDIETISLKALEKDRNRRYQSATALEDDILHYLNDEPISARRPGLIVYLRRFARKHTAIATVFVVLVAAVAGVSIFAIDAYEQRKISQAAERETNELNKELEVLLEDALEAREVNKEQNTKLVEKQEEFRLLNDQLAEFRTTLLDAYIPTISKRVLKIGTNRSVKPTEEQRYYTAMNLLTEERTRKLGSLNLSLLIGIFIGNELDNFDTNDVAKRNKLKADIRMLKESVTNDDFGDEMINYEHPWNLTRDKLGGLGAATLFALTIEDQELAQDMVDAYFSYVSDLEDPSEDEIMDVFNTTETVYEDFVQYRTMPLLAILQSPIGLKKNINVNLYVQLMKYIKDTAIVHGLSKESESFIDLVCADGMGRRGFKEEGYGYILENILGVDVKDLPAQQNDDELLRQMQSGLSNLDGQMLFGTVSALFELVQSGSQYETVIQACIVAFENLNLHPRAINMLTTIYVMKDISSTGSPDRVYKNLTTTFMDGHEDLLILPEFGPIVVAAMLSTGGENFVRENDLRSSVFFYITNHWCLDVSGPDISPDDYESDAWKDVAELFMALSHWSFVKFDGMKDETFDDKWINAVRTSLSVSLNKPIATFEELPKTQILQLEEDALSKALLEAVNNWDGGKVRVLGIKSALFACHAAGLDKIVDEVGEAIIQRIEANQDNEAILHPYGLGSLFRTTERWELADRIYRPLFADGYDVSIAKVRQRYMTRYPKSDTISNEQVLEELRRFTEVLVAEEKFDEAKDRYKQLIALRLNQLVEKGDLDLLSDMTQLAYLESSREAIPIYRELYDLQKSALGETHQDTLATLNSLGWSMICLEQYDDECLKLHEKLVRQRREVLGDSDLDLISSINNLGWVLYKLKRYDEAEPYYLESLETRSRILGEEHPDTLYIFNNIGELLASQGQFNEAENHLLKAFNGRQRVLGDEHPNTIWTINALIELYDAWDKPEESKKYRDMLPEEDTPTEDSE